MSGLVILIELSRGNKQSSHLVHARLFPLLSKTLGSPASQGPVIAPLPPPQLHRFHCVGPKGGTWPGRRRQQPEPLSVSALTSELQNVTSQATTHLGRKGRVRDGCVSPVDITELPPANNSGLKKRRKFISLVHQSSLEIDSLGWVWWLHIVSPPVFVHCHLRLSPRGPRWLLESRHHVCIPSSRKKKEERKGCSLQCKVTSCMITQGSF